MTRVRAEMPEVEPRRGAHWWIPPLGFAVLAIVMFAYAWSVALHPNGYAGYRFSQGDRFYGGDSGVWKFPMDRMIDAAAWMAGELAIITGVCALRLRSSVASRSITLGLVMFGFMLLAALPLIMHASAPNPQFLLLQFLGTIWLVGFGLTSKALARRPFVR